jgi:predicted NBD/HSP70 family sugar kinase
VRALVREADLSLPSVRRLTLGTPGIERPDGTIALAANIPGFDRVPVGRELESRLKVPVTVENDVNLAALGEQWQGVARGYEDFAYLAIGTGVGVGLVMGGELQRGWRGAAGEVGYLPIGTDRITPRVRRVGAFELAVAGPAIRRAMIDALPRYPQSLLSPRSSVADIFALAGQDDPLATHLLEREVELLTKGIVSIVAIADPALIVLGGGVGSNVTLLEPLRRAVRRATTSPVRLEVSTLGLRAPLLGAIEIGAAQARRELLASRTAGG